MLMHKYSSSSALSSEHNETRTQKYFSLETFGKHNELYTRDKHYRHV